MQSNRRKFLKIAGLTGLGVAGSNMLAFAEHNTLNTTPVLKNNELQEMDQSIIGLYGKWASSLKANKLPDFSFRKKEWKNIEAWRKAASLRLTERLAIPDIGGKPLVKLVKQYSYDGLQVEELSWQLPYGRPTDAIL